MVILQPEAPELKRLDNGSEPQLLFEGRLFCEGLSFSKKNYKQIVIKLEEEFIKTNVAYLLLDMGPYFTVWHQVNAISTPPDSPTPITPKPTTPKPITPATLASKPPTSPLELDFVKPVEPHLSAPNFVKQDKTPEPDFVKQDHAKQDKTPEPDFLKQDHVKQDKTPEPDFVKQDQTLVPEPDFIQQNDFFSLDPAFVKQPESPASDLDLVEQHQIPFSQVDFTQKTNVLSLDPAFVNLDKTSCLDSDFAKPVETLSRDPASVNSDRNPASDLTFTQQTETPPSEPEDPDFVKQEKPSASEPDFAKPVESPSPEPDVSQQDPDLPLDPTFIKRCEHELTTLIGPIATILVQRTLTQKPNISASQLVEVLANRLPNPETMKAFRRSLSSLNS